MKIFGLFILEIALRAVAAEAGRTRAKESAEQLFRRLMASDSPPANACYVLAAMLERKRVLKQVKTEQTPEGRVAHLRTRVTGDVFIVPDPRLRLDELENVQNEVAELTSRSRAKRIMFKRTC